MQHASSSHRAVPQFGLTYAGRGGEVEKQPHSIAAAKVCCKQTCLHIQCLTTTSASVAVLPAFAHVCCSWNDFTAGFTVGALSGVAWAYACTQFLPYYS